MKPACLKQRQAGFIIQPPCMPILTAETKFIFRTTQPVQRVVLLSNLNVLEKFYGCIICSNLEQLNKNVLPAVKNEIPSPSSKEGFEEMAPGEPYLGAAGNEPLSLVILVVVSIAVLRRRSV